jgi:hypothetical protein
VVPCYERDAVCLVRSRPKCLFLGEYHYLLRMVTPKGYGRPYAIRAGISGPDRYVTGGVNGFILPKPLLEPRLDATGDESENIRRGRRVLLKEMSNRFERRLKYRGI